MFVLSASLLLAPLAQSFDPMAPITKEVEEASRTATGDFNGDGQADLVLFSRSGSKALLHLGDGLGSFDRALVIETDLGGIAAAAAGDLNGDGILDLVLISKPAAGELGRTLLGVGDGTFDPPSPLSMPTFGERLGRVRIVDLDSDGDMDIVMGGDVIIGFQNLGSGLFGPAQTLAGLFGYDVTFLDIDGDGDLDLAQARPTTTGVILFEQVAPFQFSYASDVATGAGAGRIEAADLDNDGDLDLVLVHIPSGVTTLVENQGAGVFAYAATLDFVADCSDFEVIDVNRDGRLDLVGTAAAPNSSFWFENVAAFSFNYRVLPNAGEPSIRTLSPADFNGDGVDDLAFTRGAGDVDILLSDVSLGSVPYGPASAPLHAVLPEFENAITADLDGDGDAEIVATTINQGIYVAENIGFASFGELEQVVAPVPGGFLGARALRAVDVDGDSDQDILCVSTQGELIWLEGDGTGSLLLQTIDPGGPRKVGQVYPVDVDGDGDLDLAVSGPTNAALVLDQTSPGVFAAPVPAVTVPGDLDELRVADIDRDGIEDLALLTSPSQGLQAFLRWSKGNGDGTFQPQALLLDGFQDVDQFELIEFLGSGRSPDFLWNSRTDPQLDKAWGSFSGTYLLQQGVAQLAKRGQRFALAPILPFSSYPDLVVQEGVGTLLNPAQLVVYRGSSSSFTRFEVVASDLDELNSISVHDLNGDDAGDILVVSETIPRLAWLRNRSRDFASTRYCSPAVPNMTGQPASMTAFNGAMPFNQEFILQANNLPTGATTVFLTSLVPGFQPVVPGSIGTLCLGSGIGRYVGPGQVQTSSADGVARLNTMRNMMPQPGGFVAAPNGSVWYFQAWFRDSQGGAPVSNFTDGLALRFL